MTEFLYDLKNEQKSMLTILKDIDNMLDTHSIPYSLYAGTLLGAIRHKGFIPWDDDIDIMVSRESFERIVMLFDNNGGEIEINDNRYIISRKLWVYQIKQISSSNPCNYVDVFVVDNCPDSKVGKCAKNMLVKLLQGMMKDKPILANKRFIYKICLLVTYYLGKPLSDNRKMVMYEHISKIGNANKTESVSVYNDEYKLIGVSYPNTLLNNISKKTFEKEKLSVTDLFDVFLRTQYGDYMKLPPISERKPTHMISFKGREE